MTDPQSQGPASNVGNLSSQPPPVKKRLSFNDCFWSSDYQSGVNVLFDKLDQGVAENSQLLDFVASRISLESTYATNLRSAVDSISSSRNAALGFNRDEGASTKQAFVSFLDESSLQSETHARVATVLEGSVRTPLVAFAANHKKQITTARSSLSQAIKSYNKALQKTKKAKESYYTKASQLEELTNSSVSVMVTAPSQLHSSSPSFSRSLNSSKNFLSHTTKSDSPHVNNAFNLKTPLSENLSQSNPASSLQNTQANLNTPNIQVTASSPSPIHSSNINIDTYTIIGGREFDKPALIKLISGFWANVPHETYKIPIIGSYENVSSGENILHYIRTTLRINNLGFAEEFAQSLIEHGFLRLVGAIGNSFSGTTNSKYQWLPKTIVLAEMATKSKNTASNSNRHSFILNSNTVSNNDATSDSETKSSSSLSSENSTSVTSEDSLDETTSTMVKRTSNIVSGYFSNLLHEGNLNNGFGQNTTNAAQFGHSNQDIAFVSDNDRPSSTKSLHSQTLSTTNNDTPSSSGIRREPQITKLQREVIELDSKYQETVENLDQERCLMEQRIYEIFSSVQLCERERLKEVKNTFSRFAAAIGESVPPTYQSIQRLGMHSEHIDPLNDLDYLIERYKTGPFCPKPVVYLGFFGNSRKQSFGVDLKYVPFIVDEFIKYIACEKHVLGSPKSSYTELVTTPKTPSNKTRGIGGTADFPPIPDTESRGKYVSHLTSSISRDVLVSLWSGPQSPVGEIQELRKSINTGVSFSGSKVFPNYSLQVIISTLCEVFLELPNNIISYDATKAIYPKQTSSSDSKSPKTADDIRTATETRINDFVRILSILDRDDLAALKILIYHFADVCEIANETSSPLSSPDSPPSTIPTPPLYFSDAEIPSKVKNLAKAMAPYLVRPRVVTALTMTDKHPTLVVQDLILYHEQVFTGIDARTNRAHAARRRSASGSEANRRFNIEERNKAIVAAAQKNGGVVGMTPSLSMSKILALNNKPSSPASSHNGSASNSISGSAPNSPPRNGPLPLTLSSHIKSKKMSLGSYPEEELGHHSIMSPPGYNGDLYGDGFGSPLSGMRSNNGSSSSLQPPQHRALHRKSSSTSKRLSMSFLDPPLKSANMQNVAHKHVSHSSVESAGSLTSSGSSHSSTNSNISRISGPSTSINGTPRSMDSPTVLEPSRFKTGSEASIDNHDNINHTILSHSENHQPRLNQPFPAVGGIPTSGN